MSGPTFFIELLRMWIPDYNKTIVIKRSTFEFPTNSCNSNSNYGRRITLECIRCIYDYIQSDLKKKVSGRFVGALTRPTTTSSALLSSSSFVLLCIAIIRAQSSSLLIPPQPNFMNFLRDFPHFTCPSDNVVSACPSSIHSSESCNLFSCALFAAYILPRTTVLVTHPVLLILTLVSTAQLSRQIYFLPVRPPVLFFTSDFRIILSAISQYQSHDTIILLHSSHCLIL